MSRPGTARRAPREPLEVREGDLDPIDVGWVIAGRMDAADDEAICRARDAVAALMRGRFPHYTWNLPLVRRRELVRAHQASPVELLDAGVVELTSGRWDYALVLTESDLVGYDKPFALGAPSQLKGVAVLSTARLDPASLTDETTDDERVEAMTRRITALALHLFGHLNDLPHSDDPSDYMYDINQMLDLDAMDRYAPRSLQRLEPILARVADVRLEETEDWRRAAGPSFVLRALWHDRRTIVRATIETKPWLFPFQLARLSTAAASALLILVNTAEAWDLGMSQTPASAAALSIVVLLGTSLYVMKNQHLLRRRTTRGWTERRVVSTLSIGFAVLIGMATLYALLFIGNLAIESLLFNDRLVAGWAASIEGPITLGHHLVFSAFVASVGLIIGAMGASFEVEDYVRHVALVDEET